MVFVTGIVNRFGEDATAGFGAASRVDQLAFMPAMTLSLAVSTVTAQNLGAGLYLRVRQAFWWGLASAGAMTLAASLLVVLVPNMWLRIFTSDPAVIHVGSDYLRIVGLSYLFFAVMFISNGVINGAGQTFITTVISLISLWVVRVPLALYLTHRLDAVTGVWYAIAVSFAVSMLSSLVYFSTGRWRRSVVPHGPPAFTETALFGEQTGEA
jgi:Na+-driven multidrug efflux pump